MKVIADAPVFVSLQYIYDGITSFDNAPLQKCFHRDVKQM